MKYILTILISLSLLSFAQAQQRGGDRREALNTLRIGMITEKINLTSEQAKEFWPVYNAYTDEKQNINRNIRFELRKSSQSDLSDIERLASQDKVLKLKEEDIGLTKKYREKLLKVISTKQYSELQMAEESFNRMLLEELKKRKERSNP